MTMNAVDTRPNNSLETIENARLKDLSVTCVEGEVSYDFGMALNYGFTAGSPQLLRFITEHIEMIHKPPNADWACAVTCGTTSALDILFRILLDRGDWVLMESYTYPGTKEAMSPLSARTIGIEMDKQGIIPKKLEDVLVNWDSSRGNKPIVLYMIPSGHNPTGVTQSSERRKAIYEIAERHDLIILEDDPYYFLHLEAAGKCQNLDDYIRILPPSYLSLDTSGRVIRLDSASKILSPGLRCGWISGASHFVDKFLNYTEFSTVAPSGPSQVMIYKLLDESWGHAGFLAWLFELSTRYQACRNTLLRACEKYLPRQRCHWVIPEVGMFVWIRVDAAPACRSRRTATAQLSTDYDLEDTLYRYAKESGVQVSKGSWFATETPSGDTGCYLRLTFGAIDEKVLDEAVRRLGEAFAQAQIVS